MVTTHNGKVGIDLVMISVVVPTRNKGESIACRLRSLFRQTLARDRYEIIVVDNESTDDTRQVLAQLSLEAENLRWVTEPIPGRARARNRGIRESAGDLVVFLDDDIQVGTDHLERHLAYHTKSEPVTVISQVVDVSPTRPSWLRDYLHARQTIGASRSKNQDVRTPLGLYFTTGNVSLLRDTLESIRIGDGNSALYFDPSLNVREDGDMGCRLVKMGVQFLFADDIVCYHNHPRDLDSLLKRSYEVGYSTVRLIEKHPELAAHNRLTTSIRTNSSLLVACVGLFLPAFLMRPLWTEPFYKIIGGLLLHQANRGYQSAWRERKMYQ
ncbi:MAG: glycosyltransferase [Chloroflexi bacterium]|nr:glycosyltransferase [Chloroflexota bacterium]MBU1750213.1 glycosyltransferase [Chloroflexota bacterium]